MLCDGIIFQDVRLYRDPIVLFDTVQKQKIQTLLINELVHFNNFTDSPQNQIYTNVKNYYGFPEYYINLMNERAATADIPQDEKEASADKLLMIYLKKKFKGRQVIREDFVPFATPEMIIAMNSQKLNTDALNIILNAHKTQENPRDDYFLFKALTYIPKLEELD